MATRKGKRDEAADAALVRATNVPGLFKVPSSSAAHTDWTVRIGTGGDAVCGCPATKECWHIRAVRKHLLDTSNALDTFPRVKQTEPSYCKHGKPIIDLSGYGDKCDPCTDDLFRLVGQPW